MNYSKSIVTFILLLKSSTEALQIHKVKSADPLNLSKIQKDEFVETGQSLGQKMSLMSSLSLSMLNKKNQMENDQPLNNEMIMTSADIWQQIEEDAYSTQNTAFEAYQKLENPEKEDTMIQLVSRGDDLNDNDIMAYSTLNAETGSTDDEPAFTSGGAIMDALMSKNNEETSEIQQPEIQLAVKKAAPKKKIVPKKTHAQILADKKRQEKERKIQEKEEQEMMVMMETRKEQKKIQDAEDARILEKEQNMLQSFIEGDKEIEKEKNTDAGGGSGRTVWDMEHDDESKEDTIADTTNTILKAAKKSLLAGMMPAFSD